MRLFEIEENDVEEEADYAAAFHRLFCEDPQHSAPQPNIIDLHSWSEIPLEIMIVIFSFLVEALAIVRCARVHPRWAYCADHVQPSHTRNLLPVMLCMRRMYPGEEDENEVTLLFDISTATRMATNKVQRGNDFRILSSANGWVLAARLHRPHETLLMNPATGSMVWLPPLSTLNVTELENYIWMDYIKKVSLSGNPMEDNPCHVVIICSCGGSKRILAFCRSNGPSWKRITTHPDNISDIIFTDRNTLCCVTTWGTIGRCRLTEHEPKLDEIISTLYWGRLYLVGRGEEILLLYRSEWNSDNKADRFEIHKIDFSLRTLVPVNNLGNDIIILGFDAHAPETCRLRRNNIFFLLERQDGFASRFDGNDRIFMFDLAINDSEEVPLEDFWNADQDIMNSEIVGVLI